MASKLSLFLAELKRRKVYRVGTVYVVVGAGIIGLCEAALPSSLWERIQVPVGIIILVGFPIALILAWAYELTLYVHLNPVMRKAHGLTKHGKKAESQGLVIPDRDTVTRRVAELRRYPWSSYPAYAG